MLYKPTALTETQRHQSLPLRVSQEVINGVVTNNNIRCTHFDAFRFFTEVGDLPRQLSRHSCSDQPIPRQPARELNEGGALKREDQIFADQPGCVHVHMDL